MLERNRQSERPLRTNSTRTWSAYSISVVHQHKSLSPVRLSVSMLEKERTRRSHSDPRTLNTEPIPADFTTNMTLFDTMYSPYAHSYLCWGKNEALQRHRARLVNAAINPNRVVLPTTTNLLIREPCLARGTNATVQTAVIFRSPCVANEKQRFNKNITASSFTFVGAGNATQCRQSLMSLFDSKRNDATVNCSHKQEYCTFDHTFQPKIPSNLHFIGLSGYYYVFNNLAYGSSLT